MPFMPDETWFISFHQLDPSTNQCIYFTQKQARCRYSCLDIDHQRAIEIYENISNLPAEAIGIELIKEYVLCNCCRAGLARHRDRIEDVGLWTPLAERWLAEIKQKSSHTASDSPSEESAENAILPDTVTIPATPTPSHATTGYTSSAASSPYSRPSTPTPTPDSVNTTPATSITSPGTYNNISPKTPTPSARLAPPSSAGQSQHYLCSPSANASTYAISVRSSATPEPLLSEFRAHIAEPGPADSVSSKIRDNLVRRDSESGWLYIFDRDSSPGHVKIGWTAKSVEDRLGSWSKCGYTPNLLFSVGPVPNAQRVETLTHYELLKEWRRERECKSKDCRKPHQEWFEVGKERAKEVLSDWTEFMKKAQPYDSNRSLKSQWKDFVAKAVKNGETITAKKLLKHHEQLSSAEETTSSEKSTDPVCAPKVEEAEGGLCNTPQLEEPEDPKVTAVHSDPPHIEKLASTKETLFKLGTLPESQFSFPSKSESSFAPESQFSFPSKSESSFAPKSQFSFPSKSESSFAPKSQFSFAPESTFSFASKTQPSFAPKSQFFFAPESQFPPTPESTFSFASESPSQGASFPMTENIPKFEQSQKTPVPHLLDKMEPFPNTKPSHEDVAVRVPANKELSPEETPLPPSPLFQPRGSEYKLVIREAGLVSSSKTKKPSRTDEIAELNTHLVITPSSESKPSGSSRASSPKPEAKPTSNVPTPPVKVIPGEREKVTTPTSTTHSPQNAEKDAQLKPKQGRDEKEIPAEVPEPCFSGRPALEIKLDIVGDLRV